VLPKFIDEENGEEFIDGGYRHNNIDKIMKDFLYK